MAQNKAATAPHCRQIMFDVGLPLDGQKARRVIARALDSQPQELAQRIMNYGADGKTQTSFPMVQVSRYRKGLALVGFGDEGADAASQASLAVYSHIRELYPDRLIRQHMIDLPVSAKRSPYPLRYRVGRMIVEKASYHKDWIENPEKGQPHIEGLFKRSIERQAKALSIELPDFKVSLMGARRVVPMHKLADAKAPCGMSVKLRGLIDAHFEVDLVLSGIWAAGYQLGSGWGKFNANYQRGNFQ